MAVSGISCSSEVSFCTVFLMQGVKEKEKSRCLSSCCLWSPGLTGTWGWDSVLLLSAQKVAQAEYP